MKEEGIHEDCIEQIRRLFGDHFTDAPSLDESGRIRIDDWEMRDDIQKHVADAWEQIGTDNLKELYDFSGYQKNFMRLFGFGLEGVDYGADTDHVRSIDLVE